MNTLSGFRAVIFDCDGVVVDSEELGLRSLQLALRNCGVDRSVSELSRFSGRSHNETIAQLEAESGVPLRHAGFLDFMDDAYIHLAQREELQPCVGVNALLTWLTSLRIPFTLASSGPRRKVQFSLAHTSLAHWFPRFICGDDVALAKPAPDIYLAAAALIGIPPEWCIAVEDAPNGVLAAKRAGMQVAGVTTSFSAMDLSAAYPVVDSLSALQHHLEETIRVQEESKAER